MDHSVKAVLPHRKGALARLCKQQRFESDELEELFHRYVLKLQQASVAAVSGLLLALSLTLAALHVTYAQVAAPVPIILLILAIFHATLLILLHTRLMRHSYLLPTCYLMQLLGLLILGVSLPIHNTYWGWIGWQTVPIASQGVWQAMFIVFLMYALTPLSTPIAIAYGLTLPLIQGVASVFLADTFDHLHWQQVSLYFFFFSSMGIIVMF